MTLARANTQMVDLHGKVKFVHALNLNKYNRWSVTLYLTEESLKKVREMKAEGLKNEIKRDDGGDYISFHRDPTKEMRGKVVSFPAPKVIDKEGQPMDGSKIGWGSDVMVRLETYKSGPNSAFKFFGARFDSIRVDNLVEYNPDKQLSPEEAAAHKSLVSAADEVSPW